MQGFLSLPCDKGICRSDSTALWTNQFKHRPLTSHGMAVVNGQIGHVQLTPENSIRIWHFTHIWSLASVPSLSVIEDSYESKPRQLRQKYRRSFTFKILPFWSPKVRLIILLTFRFPKSNFLELHDLANYLFVLALTVCSNEQA